MRDRLVEPAEPPQRQPGHVVRVGIARRELERARQVLERPLRIACDIRVIQAARDECFGQVGLELAARARCLRWRRRSGRVVGRIPYRPDARLRAERVGRCESRIETDAPVEQRQDDADLGRSCVLVR